MYARRHVKQAADELYNAILNEKRTRKADAWSNKPEKEILRSSIQRNDNNATVWSSESEDEDDDDLPFKLHAKENIKPPEEEELKSLVDNNEDTISDVHSTHSDSTESCPELLEEKLLPSLVSSTTQTNEAVQDHKMQAEDFHAREIQWQLKLEQAEAETLKWKNLYTVSSKALQNQVSSENDLTFQAVSTMTWSTIQDSLMRETKALELRKHKLRILAQEAQVVALSRLQVHLEEKDDQLTKFHSDIHLQHKALQDAVHSIYDNVRQNIEEEEENSPHQVKKLVSSGTQTTIDEKPETTMLEEQVQVSIQMAARRTRLDEMAQDLQEERLNLKEHQDLLKRESRVKISQLDDAREVVKQLTQAVLSREKEVSAREKKFEKKKRREVKKLRAYKEALRETEK